MSPDGSANPSPEEKLLTFIRGAGGRARPAVSQPLAGGEPGGAVPAVVVWSRSTQPVPRVRWAGVAITGLGVVLVVELLWLLVQVMRPMPTVSLSPVHPRQDPSPVPVATVPLEIPSLAGSATRPLFTPPAGVSPGSTAPKASPSDAVKLLASRLTLMGIVSGDPAQAIIEDSQTKKTYFVTPGQAVVDGAVLEQVLDHRVILDLDGEKITLTL